MPVVPFPDPQSSKDSSARDVSDSWFDDESEGGKMSFLEHLDELRKRIIRALLSLSVGVVIAVYFLEDILNFVMRPLSATLPPGASFIFTYPTDAFMPRIEDTFSMYMRMLLGMAAVFQMPAMVFFLARMGVVTARWMIRQFKYAVLVIVVIAAIITTSSDVASQLIVAGTMIVIYGPRILLS